jgi:hypothetical protein
MKYGTLTVPAGALSPPNNNLNNSTGIIKL